VRKSGKYGEEYRFEPFTTWNKTKQQKVLAFLEHNEEAVRCYAAAKKARDIIPCKDPIEPQF